MNVPTPKKRYFKVTVGNVEHVIELVIEDLSDKELVAQALDVDESKLRNFGTSSGLA